MARRVVRGHPVGMQVTDSTLMQTGEAASALGIDRHTLLRWLVAGHVTPLGQTRAGAYLWDADYIAQLAARQHSG